MFEQFELDPSSSNPQSAVSLPVRLSMRTPSKKKWKVPLSTDRKCFRTFESFPNIVRPTSFARTTWKRSKRADCFGVPNKSCLYGRFDRVKFRRSNDIAGFQTSASGTNRLAAQRQKERAPEFFNKSHFAESFYQEAHKFTVCVLNGAHSMDSVLLGRASPQSVRIQIELRRAL